MACVELAPLWLIVGGLRCFARVATAAAHPGRLPLVLVHGLSVSSRYLVPTARCLAPHRAVYAPDLPGFGRSERPPQLRDIGGLAEDLLAWVDAAGIARAIMLGNSMGCQIIAEVGARHPTRLTAAIMVGPTMDRRARTAPAQIWRLIRDGRHESLASLLTQSADYLRYGPCRTLRTLAYALADPIERKLPLLHAPTLIVRGQHDPIAPQPWVEELTALLPRGELLVIPGAPHALNYDCGAELAAATLDFLGRYPEVEG